MLKPVQEKSLGIAHICLANNNCAIFSSLSYSTAQKQSSSAIAEQVQHFNNCQAKPQLMLGVRW